MTNDAPATHPRGHTIARPVLISLCAAGLILCGILLEAGSGDTAGLLDRLCEPGPHVNCASVLASPWAKIEGISAALLGIAYFGALLVWFSAIGIPNRAGRGWHLIPISGTALGLCFSGYFTWVMATKLGVWCTLCVAVHVVNLLICLVSILSRPRMPGDLPYPSHTRAGIVLGATAATAVLLALGAWSVQLQVAARRFQSEYLTIVNDPAYIEWRLSQQPPKEIPISPDDLFIGRADAKNTVVVFSDFECPNCRMFDQFAQRMINLKMPVRVVFKHFPMSTKCNPHAKETLHPRACNLARAMEAARRSPSPSYERMIKFHHGLYEAAAQSNVANAVQVLANKLELDASMIEFEFSDTKPNKKIEADTLLGSQLGVEGTPAIFLNGRRMKTSWQIVSNDVHPSLNLEATDALWKRLLGSDRDGR